MTRLVAFACSIAALLLALSGCATGGRDLPAESRSGIAFPEARPTAPDEVERREIVAAPFERFRWPEDPRFRSAGRLRALDRTDEGGIDPVAERTRLHAHFDAVLAWLDANSTASLAKAIDQVEAWFESPSLVLLSETDSHWDDLKKALTSGRVTGSMVHDARLAALCAAHGVRELWTVDRDFSRFTELRVRNPLVD